MAEFKVPELGESVAGGDVTRVLVKVGDVVARDQSVLELETDKATIDVPSSVAGRVTEVKVKQGDKIKVGAVVFVVDDADAPQAAAPADVAAESHYSAFQGFVDLLQLIDAMQLIGRHAEAGQNAAQ